MSWSNPINTKKDINISIVIFQKYKEAMEVSLYSLLQPICCESN